MQEYIPEEGRHQPYAASVKEPLWQFHIEGLHVICSGGSNSVTKHTDICFTANAGNRVYHRYKGKDFNLSNCYWNVQELFKAHHSYSHNLIHSNPYFGVTDYVPPAQHIKYQLMPITNVHISK